MYLYYDDEDAVSDVSTKHGVPDLTVVCFLVQVCSKVYKTRGMKNG
jgi:hypothetical protein